MGTPATPRPMRGVFARVAAAESSPLPSRRRHSRRPTSAMYGIGCATCVLATQVPPAMQTWPGVVHGMGVAQACDRNKVISRASPGKNATVAVWVTTLASPSSPRAVTSMLNDGDPLGRMASVAGSAARLPIVKLSVDVRHAPASPGSRCGSAPTVRRGRCRRAPPSSCRCSSGCTPPPGRPRLRTRCGRAASVPTVRHGEMPRQSPTSPRVATAMPVTTAATTTAPTPVQNHQRW